MFDVGPNGELELTQGNTGEVGIVAFDNEGVPIVPENGDRVVFKVMSGGKVAVKKVLTADDWDDIEKAFILRLEPEDTENLPAMAYKYDCMYVWPNGDAKTFINCNVFEILEAIAKKGDADG